MPPKRRKVAKPLGLKKKKKRGPQPVKKVIKNIKIEDVSQSSSADGSGDPYVCDVCNENFDKDNWEEHIKECMQVKNKLPYLQTNKAVHNCKKCKKKFKFKESFDQHILNEHSVLPSSVACNHCEVRCPDENILKEHIAKVHERDIYVCFTCSKEFVRRSHVIRHMGQSGCNGKGAASYPCEICDSTFTRKDNLMVHLRTKHIQKNLYACKSCDFAAKSFTKLVRHWHNKHSGQPNTFECHNCGKATGSRAAMVKHLEIHGEKKFACDVCGYSTFTVEVMRRHILTHVEAKPYKCSLCHCSYIQRAQLLRHMDRHTGNVCLTCGCIYSSKAKLLMHHREHLGLNKLSCTFEGCPMGKKVFATEAGLETHLKCHLVSKTYACEVCNKAFHSEVNMRRHMSVHTLDRPRRCMYCVVPRAYVRGEQLVRHVRRRHPALFQQHLEHVRRVLGMNTEMERVKKSELDSILNVMDAESERIMRISGSGVLYGGMQDDVEKNDDRSGPLPLRCWDNVQTESGPLMMEEELAENLNNLLSKLIDKETLECFGWPEETVDMVLEKVIEQCGARVADRATWSRVQCLRENAKHLFLYVIEDKTITRMLETHTIDQIIKHILAQVTEKDDKS